MDADLGRWLPTYRWIADLLGLDPAADAAAAEALDDLLEEHGRVDPGEVEERLGGGPVVVLGNGPSAGRDLGRGVVGGGVPVVAADGAAAEALRAGLVPEVVVTDLDGDPDILEAAGRAGSILVVHAHGDNLGRLRSLVPRLAPCLGTTQAAPVGGVRNFGGFTDGDRAAHLAAAAGADGIILAGMDLAGVSRHDEESGKDLGRKFLKLEVAARLLADLAAEVRVATLTGWGREIPGVERVGSLWEAISIWREGRWR